MATRCAMLLILSMVFLVYVPILAQALHTRVDQSALSVSAYCLVTRCLACIERSTHQHCLTCRAHRPPARPGAAGSAPIAAMEWLARPWCLRHGRAVRPRWRAGVAGRVRAVGGIACLRTSSSRVRCACRSPCREAAPAAQRSGMPGG